MKEPLISVALCTYNGEKYIKTQLESIIGQSYKNLEVIIVDDDSTDQTFDIVSNYAKTDTRIKCYKNRANLGFNKNFEKALTLTTGEYIAISDQDDSWLPHKLQALLAHIKDNWLIFSNSSYIGQDKQRNLLRDFKLPAGYKGILLRNYITGHTSLLKKEFLDFALPFPKKGYYDWWLGFVAAYHHKITYLDEVLTHHRIHEESVITKQLQQDNKEQVEYNNITAMLGAFSAYKNLKPADKAFIKQLVEAYQLKGAGSRSMPLLKIIYKNYRLLFPNRKPWKSLTKLIFAFKFSKGLNN